MSRRHVVVATAVVCGAVVLGGCTSGSDDPPEPEGATEQPQPSGSAGTSTPEREVGDVSPEELSEQLVAAATETAEPVGSTTGPVENGADTTLDVLEVRPLDEGTLLRFRLTAAEVYGLGANTFADDRFGTRNFVRDVYLDDPASGTRLLPLQFEDYRAACVCPYKPLELGPEPSELTAVFPALPQGTQSVDVGLGGDSPLTVADVPVG